MQYTRITSGRRAHKTLVNLSDGRRLSADLVVVGIGVTPDLELALDAGLPVAAGVIVDSHLKDHRSKDLGDRRLGIVFPPAHRRCAASCVRAECNRRDASRPVSLEDQSHTTVFWFRSDQANDKLQIAGLTASYDHAVVRGEPAQGSFSVFCFKSSRLIGIESVNRPSDHVFGRRILATRHSIQPEAATDSSFDLRLVAAE